MEEQLGIRLRIAPAFGEVRSMRGIRMRFEEQPGSATQDPPGDSRRHPPRLEAPEVTYALLNAHDAAATPEGTERQEEDVAQHLGGLQEYRRITPMALFALQAAADAGEPRVRLNRAPDWPPRRVQLLRLRLHVAKRNSRARQSRASLGSQFVGRMPASFHAAQRIGAAQGLLQLAGTAGGRWRQRWKHCP